MDRWDPAVLAERAARVRARIASAGADPEAVALVAVTKGFPAEAAQAAVDAGLTDVGESYAQELVAKAAVVRGARWHFIGPVQRNKVRSLAPHVTLWQALDRAVAGVEVARRAPGAAVLVEVNVGGEAAKHGCAPGEAAALVDALRSLGLDVRGLMTVAPRHEAVPGTAFGALARLADELGLVERSMGMSQDLEAAVQSGATMVRVGTALFGPRPVGAAAAGSPLPRSGAT